MGGGGGWRTLGEGGADVEYGLAIVAVWGNVGREMRGSEGVRG